MNNKKRFLSLGILAAAIAAVVLFLPVRRPVEVTYPCIVVNQSGEATGERKMVAFQGKYRDYLLRQDTFTGSLTVEDRKLELVLNISERVPAVISETAAAGEGAGRLWAAPQLEQFILSFLTDGVETEYLCYPDEGAFEMAGSQDAGNTILAVGEAEEPREKAALGVLSVKAAGTEGETAAQEIAGVDSKSIEKAPAWDKDSIYTAGDRVMRQGAVYEAAWWTQGEDPAQQQDEWGVWRLVTEEAAMKTADTKTAEKTVTAKTTKETAAAKTAKAPAATDKKTGLASHVITGYWQNFDNGAECLKISDVPKEYSLIAVAFAEAVQTPGKVIFRLDETLCRRLGGYTKKQFIKDIKSAKKKGQRVIISVGGENGTVSVTNAKEAKRFADSVYKLMEEYGFDGVDIDLEHGINAAYMAKALKRLSKKAGDSLIITMAPQTLDMQNTQTEYFKLALKIKDILTIVNTQYYNSGTMLGADGKVYGQGSVDFLTALAAIQLENGLRPDQVGLGLPASSKGAGSGYVSPSIVNKALNCLAKGKKGGAYQPKKKYPKLRGAMVWSINWDAANGYKFLKKVAPTVEELS